MLERASTFLWARLAADHLRSSWRQIKIKLEFSG
jgi:hypothetical protein